MLIIPDILLAQNIELLLKYVYNDYRNINQAVVYGFKDLSAGFDWLTTPQTATINTKLVTINVLTSTIDETIIELNKSLKVATLTDLEFFEVSSKYVCLRTISTKSTTQTLILVEGTGLLKTLLIDIGIYTGQTTKENTILYNYFETLNYDRYNYTDELYKILDNTFSKSIGNQQTRKIVIKNSFNPNQDLRPPMIIISMGAESTQDSMITGELINTSTAITRLKQRKYNANYKISIISDSKNEVILLYNFLKSLIEANLQTFAYLGIINMSIAGGDTLVEIEIPNMFTNVIDLNFVYVNEIPISIDTTKVFTDLFFKGTFVI